MAKGKNGVKVVKPKTDTTEWVIYRSHSHGSATWGQYWDGTQWVDEATQAQVYVGLDSLPLVQGGKVGRAAFALTSIKR